MGKDNKFQLVKEFVLVEHPENLSYMDQKNYWEDAHDIAVIDGNKLWVSTESRVVEFSLKKETITAQISKDIFMSKLERGANTKETVYSASNLKSLGMKNNHIIYTQTMKDANNSTEFYIVHESIKYTFHLDGNKQFYKARWA